ncbi:MAG: hypothetical protein ACRDCS_11025 [Tannerellaceae bacterium]
MKNVFIETISPQRIELTAAAPILSNLHSQATLTKLSRYKSLSSDTNCFLFGRLNHSSQ